MIENRELTMDDYLAMLRRRAKVILIPALLAPIVGFLVSYAFPRKYTSQATILIEGQKVPETMVQPVATEDPSARINTLLTQATSPAALKPMLKGLPEKSEPSIDELIDGIVSGKTLTVVPVDLTQTSLTRRKPGQASEPAFTLSYTDSNAHQAQQICFDLTSLLQQKSLEYMQDRATGTTNVLKKGLDDAKRNLDDMDGKLAEFKKQYVGQLPGDEENNLKILMGLNTQLEANTQNLNRAQQDKAYTESMLASQLAAWKSSQSSTNPQTLEKQLSDMQAQLLDLQAKYTDDHPDVIKTKADIAEVKKKLAEINKASSDATEVGTDKASAMEPPEIRQMRTQVHQYGDFIAAATRDQKRLQQEIEKYQGRVSLSPTIEEQYKELTRDYDNAQKGYQDLLSKKSAADMTENMTSQSEGERMSIVNQASLPDSPSFPNRWLFAGGGLGAGLAIGIGLSMWLELRDKSIRTEADAEAALELPMLVAVPWVGIAAAENGNGKNGRFKFWKRKDAAEHKEKVGV